MGILIVDDNPVHLIVMEKILKNAGYPELMKATSAIEMFSVYPDGYDDAGDGWNSGHAKAA
ncbi:hypothetical protein ERICIV_01681 [Paenibacillus larvae subsp. larvae]|uniref:Response regulatory domain-containing protein n=1 Tax=Paenibacillus larvae subsp. larvae TaxID=147375 RepID=A0A2L1TYU4_9BACL|nr:hypothetical protein ERICIII_01660 [Paenibacillus larvae subsp. larvae]AVF30619.1 hypothetical protein ERICIV_01681 [Paenibacillus larvae subsp. larvae]MBH0342025.1 hypothetical protein [Paenibacillus larvae]